jgi:hypothetical protein
LIWQDQVSEPFVGNYSVDYGFLDEHDSYEDSEITKWMNIPEVT